MHAYLQNVAGQLVPEGIYVVADEFLSEYRNEDERKINAVVWYSHVIASAKRAGHDYLAEEEAKTLLDDLNEASNDSMKSRDQIALVLDSCDAIKTTDQARDFLSALKPLMGVRVTGDETIDLSRGDYKICDSVFRREIEEADLRVVERVTVGPVDTIGGMAVYVLKTNYPHVTS